MAQYRLGKAEGSQPLKTRPPNSSYRQSSTVSSNVLSSLLLIGVGGDGGRATGRGCPTTPPSGSPGRGPRQEHGTRARGARRSGEPTGTTNSSFGTTKTAVVVVVAKVDLSESPVDVRQLA